MWGTSINVEYQVNFSRINYNYFYLCPKQVFQFIWAWN